MSCQFYLEKKKRNCRFQPKQGTKYCVEHACVLGIEAEKKRIPCPLDPSHNCFEDKLDKHLKKCNVAKLRKVSEQSEYFVKGINLGGSETRSEKHDNVSVRELTSDQLATMIDKVKQLYKDYVEVPEVHILEHPSVKVEVTTEIKDIKDGNKDSSPLVDTLTENPNLRKELLQQASLIGQLASKELLKGTSWFVELGAGKGKLSHWVKKACTCWKSNSEDQSEGDSTVPAFLLVDRSSVRYKMDCFHKEDSGGSHFKRIKVDIADLCLGKVSAIKGNNSIVVMGKHLCGGATDLGIRCAVDSLAMAADISTDSDNSALKQSDANINKSRQCDSRISRENLEPPLKSQRLEDVLKGRESKQRLPKGIMIALCCHHRCTWDSYVGQEYMHNCGVTPTEFDLLTRLSSWATCARGKATKKTQRKTKEEEMTAEENSNRTTSDIDHNQQNDTGPSQVPKEDITDQESLEDHTASDMVSSHISQGFREGLSVSAREEVGRMCKRIIDMGRLHYLRSKGMTSSLQEYVSDEVTPENVVLLAVRS